MKIEFLHKEAKNTRLILVFAGWSAGPEAGRDIRREGWDVAVVHDFSELKLNTDFLEGYYTIYLFAWSLGVFAAELLLPADKITAAFAINGTLSPVDDELGIPTVIYDGTESRLDARNLLKFRLRMAGSRENLADMRKDAEEIPLPENDDIENLRLQLRNIREAAKKRKLDARLPWLRAYISNRDAIFPPVNMKNFWEGVDEVETVNLDEPHYVRISQIVQAVIADTERISERFQKANVTYDTHAIAQYSAAIKLANKFEEIYGRIGGGVLEIGCGTGLFTREYAGKVRPSEITFVDITATGPFGVAEREEYVQADAERWIENEERQWNAIVSASAIQWFADIPRFLHECRRHLRPGGVLAISTFSAGNMRELDELRPSPLIYPKANEIRELLKGDFSAVEVSEEEISVEFQSVREMLMHLKHTGVAGSGPSTGLSISRMSHLRSLTYRPLYIIAKL